MWVVGSSTCNHACIEGYCGTYPKSDSDTAQANRNRASAQSNRAAIAFRVRPGLSDCMYPPSAA